jgi:hypothetical protein
MIMGNETSQKSEMIFNDASRQSGDEMPGEGNWASPFIHEFFMVQGSGFRCMAYRNEDGKWHGAFDDAELTGAIRVLE